MKRASYALLVVISFDKIEGDKPIAPGKPFWIVLTLQNTGSCIWTHQYKVQYNSGTRLHAGPDTFAFMQPGFKVSPGETFNLQMQFTAPSETGSYESSYSVIDENGKTVLNFGIPTRVGTPSSNALLGAPGDLRYQYSCTPGVVSITLAWQDRSNNEDGFRIYRDGAKLTDLPAGSTTYEDILTTPGSYAYTVAAFNAGGEASINVNAETTNCQ